MIATPKVTATLTSSEASARNWDVGIIGAGVAGASLAIRLAREGLSVILIESQRFPREKVCGGCLNQRAIHLLDEMGVLSECVAAGAVEIDTLRIRQGEREHRWTIPRMLSIRRSTLDSILVNKAIANGAQYLDQTVASIDESEADAISEVAMQLRPKNSPREHASPSIDSTGTNAIHPLRAGVASETEPFGPSTAQRMQAYQEHAGPLLHRAAQQVVDRMAQGVDSITHLVTVSCTGFCAPGIDYQLIESLGLKSTVERTHVGFMGCHGLINGMRVASALVQSNPQARVLVGAVELCSVHQQYSEDSDQLVASALFSDGAGCLLLESDRSEEPSSSGGWEILSSLSRKLEDTADLMAWSIGNHGFQMTLSPRIPAVIEAQLYDPITEWLAGEQLALSDIRSWAVHPGGPRVIDAAGKALGLEDAMLQPSRDVLWEYGNMSSPTVLFILERCHPVSSTGDHVVMLAFGPGLQVEALLLRRV